MRAAKETSLTIPTSGSMWKVTSIWSLTHGRSPEGTPSSSQMTMDGSVAPKSATKSKSAPSAHGASSSAHSSRMCPSRLDIRRGVKARDTRARSRVCSGGSWKIIMPLGVGCAVIISSTVPWPETNVAGSRWAVSTSS